MSLSLLCAALLCDTVAVWRLIRQPWLLWNKHVFSSHHPASWLVGWLAGHHDKPSSHHQEASFNSLLSIELTKIKLKLRLKCHQINWLTIVKQMRFFFCFVFFFGATEQHPMLSPKEKKKNSLYSDSNWKLLLKTCQVSGPFFRYKSWIHIHIHNIEMCPATMEGIIIIISNSNSSNNNNNADLYNQSPKNHRQTHCNLHVTTRHKVNISSSGSKGSDPSTK